MPILDPALRENDDPGPDPIQLDRAVQRAAADLQRIVGTLVHYLHGTAPARSTGHACDELACVA
jgi:hypothetical protein